MWFITEAILKDLQPTVRLEYMQEDATNNLHEARTHAKKQDGSDRRSFLSPLLLPLTLRLSCNLPNHSSATRCVEFVGYSRTCGRKVNDSASADPRNRPMCKQRRRQLLSSEITSIVFLGRSAGLLKTVRSIFPDTSQTYTSCRPSSRRGDEKNIHRIFLGASIGRGGSSCFGDEACACSRNVQCVCVN